MFIKNTTTDYVAALILSTGKKNFENMGRSARRSGSQLARSLQSVNWTRTSLETIAQSVFFSAKIIYLSVDETLIKKIYAAIAQGSGEFYDPGSKTTHNGYKLSSAAISDGRTWIPLDGNFLFAEYITERCKEKFLSKIDFAKQYVAAVRRMFPGKKNVLVADGHYSNVEMLKWCVENNVSAEMRMHSNRIVTYNGTQIKLSQLLSLPGLKPSNRRSARTIRVEWHGLLLWVTIVKRTNKHDEDSFVFQVATYKAEPRVHVRTYKMRWPVEKKYRTTKQTLGLADCQSRNLTTQHKHVMSVLLAYAITQLKRRKHRLKNSEEAIRRIREECHGLTFSKSVELIGSLVTAMA